MAKKTAKKATKPTEKKTAKSSALSKKAGATKASSKTVKKSTPVSKKAAAKKSSPVKSKNNSSKQKNNKPVKKAPAKAVKKSAPAKPVKASKPVKVSKPAKPAKSTKPATKPAASKSAKSAKQVKPVAKPAPAKSQKSVNAPVAKKAELLKKSATTKKAEPVKKVEPKKAEIPKKAESPKKVEAPKKAEAIKNVTESAPVEKKMTQAQLKAIAKKERDYRNSAEFKATLPVRKRNPEEVFEAYKPKKDVRTSKHIKFELEYFFNASNRLLYEFFSTASGLQDWFADDVRINRDGTLSFFWEGTEQKAKLLFKRDGVVARYKWVEEPSDTYFEFRIEIDDLTGDVAMIITDFAEDQQSVENAKMLWDSQVNSLKHAIGAY